MPSPVHQNRHFRHSIRFKLLLVSLTLLSIPWAGYRFIHETEIFLRDAQNQHMFISANAVATLLKNHPNTFERADQELTAQPNRSLYLHALKRAPIIDGYPDEWELLEKNFSHLRQAAGALSADIFLGVHEEHMYILLGVTDVKLDYGEQGDHVDLAMISAEGKTLRFRIQPLSPGWVKVKRMLLTTAGLKESEADLRIRGEWQETPKGYTLELKIPLQYIDRRFSISIRDTANDAILSNAPMSPASNLGYLVRPSVPLESLLKSLAPPNTRLWITDQSGLVLARAGILDIDAPLHSDIEQMPWIIRQIILWVIPQTIDGLGSLRNDQTRLDIPPVVSALMGKQKAYRQKIENSNAVIVSAAVPITTTEGTVGSVLVEQTTNAILSIQNLALQRLFGITLTLFAFTSFGLLAFASFLIARIRRLRNAVEKAVTHDGRIVAHLPSSGAHDEIGDLNRSFANVLDRLNAYNNYLEGMASRLAHEMRTPLTVVHTSLDNARQTSGDQQQQYIQRAEQGIERLQNILKRLREATRLEQALGQAQTEPLNICDMLHSVVESYQSIHPQVEFTLEVAQDHACQFEGVPDLLYQAMEKLLTNAVDFHEDGTAISTSLKLHDQELIVLIKNIGPVLPGQADIFQSMTSIRTSSSPEPHLGLGLYLVKLIVEFHFGTVLAQNLAEQNGVEFIIKLPLSMQRAKHARL